MAQLVEENKSLWRMKEKYKQDAGKCPECSALWERLVKEKEEQARLLEEMLKMHQK